MSMIETLWHLSVLDIEATLRAATGKLLGDRTVDKAVLERRARALVIAGRVFEAALCPDAPEEEGEEGGQSAGAGVDCDGEDEDEQQQGRGGVGCIGGKKSNEKKKKKRKTWKDFLRDQMAAGAQMPGQEQPTRGAAGGGGD